MTHCSRGGVQGRGVSDADADRYTDPAAYIPIFEAFPRLRICLAHFGGARDWRDYIETGIDPDDRQARTRNWQVAIRDMIGTGKYPGLWTDISYTLFHFQENLPFLQLFLQGNPDVDRSLNRLRRRVLFGSDFYMTRQERMSERAVCFSLRNALGEDMFWQIAETNPALWLGEASEFGYPGN
jgi:predicted TIM-barrel fold metal-dependent hydrolase